jgi:hypothetical protein
MGLLSAKLIRTVCSKSLEKEECRPDERLLRHINGQMDSLESKLRLLFEKGAKERAVDVEKIGRFIGSELIVNVASTLIFGHSILQIERLFLAAYRPTQLAVPDPERSVEPTRPIGQPSKYSDRLSARVQRLMLDHIQH